MRLDLHLVDKGVFESRARAQAAIKSGCVTVDGRIERKPSAAISSDMSIKAAAPHPYVSRGGVKLAHALSHWNVDVANAVCLDLGASTGGFTEVLLMNGAAKVYAVDVGRGQLHEKLRGDARVISLEGVHAKDLSRDLAPDAVDVIVCDVSFISLRKALPQALVLAAPGAWLVALVKPQFEVGPGRIGKGGLVKGATDDVPVEIGRWLEDEAGWSVIGVCDSPIVGGDGNREHLIAARTQI
ncbi:MAG: TlyA family RNA methyltransferase [Pseudomonadota bacterium]